MLADLLCLTHVRDISTDATLYALGIPDGDLDCTDGKWINCGSVIAFRCSAKVYAAFLILNDSFFSELEIESDSERGLRSISQSIYDVLAVWLKSISNLEFPADATLDVMAPRFSLSTTASFDLNACQVSEVMKF